MILLKPGFKNSLTLMTFFLYNIRFYTILVRQPELNFIQIGVRN